MTLMAILPVFGWSTTKWDLSPFPPSCNLPSSPLDQTGFLETVVPFPSYDHMVQDTKSENLSGLRQLLVHAKVGLARLEVTGWVIVGEDRGGGPGGDDIGEDLARAAVFRYVLDRFHLHTFDSIPLKWRDS